jgi:hypothetical protein
MREARAVLLLAALSLPLSGYMSCGSPGPIASVSPAEGTVIADPSFDVVIELHPTAIPATLTATLNGTPLSLAGGPTVFTATLDPGPPLLDDNVLVVKVKSTGNFGQRKTIAFQYLPPKARARRITDPADLISGPLAHGRLNDLLLENDVVRFVIQDAPQRDLHSVAQFGGNIIDAELVEAGVRQGNDNFLEVQPAASIEGVIHADQIEIVNDGENGLPAQIRACGPDDLLDYINASSEVGSLGVTLPSGTDDTDLDLDGCTTYTLEPGDRHLTIETELIYNSGPTANLYVGDYLNGAGELEQWTSNEPILGGSPAQGIGELLANASFEVLSYFGFGQGTGVDYALIPQPFPGATYPVSSSFSTGGISFVLAGSSLPLLLAGFDVPSFIAVAAGESRTFTRLFHVGDGSPGGAVGLDLAEDGSARGTLQGQVTVGGVPAPGARVVAGPESGGSITDLRSIWVTDASGHYSGQLPLGFYGVAASLEGVPYQGGAGSPDVNCTPTCPEITDAGITTLDIDLPATGRVKVSVVDDGNDPVPARVSVVGFDPSPEVTLAFAEGPLSDTAGLFRDVTKDPISYGLVWVEYTDANGVAEFNLDPGSYQLFVSRGTEYSVFQQPLNVASGPFGTVTAAVNAQIVPVIDSSGFVSSDFHVHMIDSPDSRISHANRVRSFAGEGVDNLVATDHDAITDLSPVIAALNFTPFLHSTIGEEITSFDYGHYNAYPQAVDPGVPTRGSTDWAGAAPVGQDFPSLGSYSLTPAEIEDRARNKLASGGGVQNAGLTTAVQINHIDSHFAPLRIDSSLEPPTSLLDPLAFDPVTGGPEPINPLFFRLDPTVSNFFNVFDALELWNGASQSSQDKFRAKVIGIWMNHLNQGIPITATSVTDTHTFFDLETAGPRTWTPTSFGSDAPADILDNDIGQAILDGKAVAGQGIYLQAKLVDTDAVPEATADFSWLGSTLLTATDGTVDLVIDVQAPTWAPYDTVEIYANAETCVATENEGVPVLFGAIPDLTLVAGTDFAVSTVNLPNGGQRLETHQTVGLTLAEDTWVAVLVRGTKGASGSPPMFPVYPRSLSAAENPDLAELLLNTATENGTRALGFSNALYVDVDGNAQFDAPGCAGRCGVAACAP